MLELIGRRVLGFPVLLIGVSAAIFVMINLMPGDPARYLAGPESSPELVQEVREQLRLDEPLWDQYASWLGGAVRGDLGESLIYKEAVTNLIGPRAAVTASLALFAFVFAVALSLVLALVAAAREGGVVDRAVSGFASLALAIPPFWLGMVLVLWFAVSRPWLPAIGYAPLADGLWAWASHLILPAVALGLTPAAELTLQLRASLQEVLMSDYVLSARAKGLRPHTILLKHALKNAAIPVVTVLGTRFGQLVAGAVTVETVFSLPGLGRLAVEATQGRDVPVLLAIVLLSTIAVATFNLITDISYGFLNPRVARR